MALTEQQNELLRRAEELAANTSIELLKDTLREMELSLDVLVSPSVREKIRTLESQIAVCKLTIQIKETT